MTVALSITVGVATGITSSALFWLLQAKALRPKIRLEPVMSRHRLPHDTVDRCQVKYVNRRRRPAFDLRFTVRFRMPGLVREGSIEWLLCLSESIPWVAGRSYRRHTIRPNQMPEAMIARYGKYMPTWVTQTISTGGDIDLVTFLNLCPGSSIEVTVYASDSFSGATGVERKVYTVNEIVTVAK